MTRLVPNHHIERPILPLRHLLLHERDLLVVVELVDVFGRERDPGRMGGLGEVRGLTAGGVDEGAVAGAVENHLGHGAHTVRAFAAGLVIGGLGQALQIARGVQGAAEAEGLGRDRAGQADLAQGGSVRLGAQLFEAIGLSLPNSNMVPAPYQSREQIAVAAGHQVMNLLELNLRPRDICTREAFINAARVVAATGGSTNAALHLPAMASEAGIEFDLHDVAEAFKSTPYIADLKPGGKYVAKDMHEAGGVYMLMKTMLAGGFLDGNCKTVTGKTLGENIDQVTWNPDQKVIYDVKTPLSPTGGVVGLRGTLAPEGAIVKVAGMTPEEARRAAVDRFGDTEAVRDECVRLLAEERRTQSRRDWFEDLPDA